MTEELKHHDDKSGKAKAEDPDTFDGSDPHRFNSFLLLCNFYFHNNLSYDDDDAKVTFTLTYLCGMALDFFFLNWPFPGLMHSQMVGQLVCICPYSLLPVLSYRPYCGH